SDLHTQRGTELGTWEEKYLPLLGVLAVAFNALSRDQLAAFAGVKVEYVDSILAQLLQFLDTIKEESVNRYRLYHRDFTEYLLDKTRNQAYPLDGKAYHTRISNYYRGDKETWSDVDWSKVDDDYPYRYLVDHLVAAHHSDEAQELLKQFNWMQAKLFATD